MVLKTISPGCGVRASPMLFSLYLLPSVCILGVLLLEMICFVAQLVYHQSVAKTVCLPEVPYFIEYFMVQVHLGLLL